MNDLSSVSLGRLAIPAVGLTAAAILPLFFVGALSVQIRSEMGLGEAHLGALVAIFFGTSALAGLPVRRAIESVGDYRSGLLTCLLVALGLAVIGGVARSFTGVAVGMVISGLGQAFGQPAVNGIISRGMRAERRGFVFGIKQMAIPLASLLSGISVPLLALTLGWRMVYAVGAGLTLLVPLLLPRAPKRRARVRLVGERPPVGVRRLAMSAALASAATMILASYLVETLVAGGQPPGRAGLMLAVAGLGSAVIRLGTGWAADRMERPPLSLARTLMLIGAPSLALLPLAGESLALVAIASILAYGLGWGWPPLLDLAVVDIGAKNPAASSSIMLSGAFTGAAVGPLIFGVLVGAVGYPAAWASAAAVLITAGLVVGRAGRPTFVETKAA